MASGGETKLGNLVTLCSVHHTLVHEGRFGVTVTDDGVFVFTRPDGKQIPECGSAQKDGPGGRFRGIVATGLETGDAGLAGFEESIRFHAERLNPGPNVKIDASTSRCKWVGERMDYSMAIESMQFREQAASMAGGAAPS